MSDYLKGTQVRRLRLKPGDHIVLTVTGRSSRHHIDDIAAMAKERWPGYPVTVLSDIQIDVLEAQPGTPT